MLASLLAFGHTLFVTVVNASSPEFGRPIAFRIACKPLVIMQYMLGLHSLKHWYGFLKGEDVQCILMSETQSLNAVLGEGFSEQGSDELVESNCFIM